MAAPPHGTAYACPLPGPVRTSSRPGSQAFPGLVRTRAAAAAFPHSRTDRRRAGRSLGGGPARTRRAGPAASLKVTRIHTGEQTCEVNASHADRNDRVPGRGPSAAAADDPLDLLDQGRLPPGADLQRLRRPGQAAAGRATRTRTSRSTPPTCTSRSTIDPAERTLTVRDNGIGMTRDEVIDLIGTIAKSGTAEMLAKLRRPGRPAARRRSDGRADRPVRRRLLLQLHGRRPGRRWSPARPASATGVRWESTGEGTYTHRGAPTTRRRAPPSPCTSSRRTPRTRCTTSPSPDTVREHRQALLRLHHLADPDGAGHEVGGTDDDDRGDDARAGDAQLPQGAVGAPQSEVSEEEYTEFYHHVSHDWREPLETIRLSAEGTFEYQALLFLPEPRPDGPVHAGRQARRAAVRQAGVHHGRLRGAGAGVPALRQGRRRRERPVAQHLSRDPAAGPADPADPQAPGARRCCRR